MGHKVNAVIFRIPTLWGWNSKWFSRREYGLLLRHDTQMRKIIRTDCREAGIAAIEIERTTRQVKVTIHAAKPGLIIGRGGTHAEELKKKLKSKFIPVGQDLQLNIVEVSQPNLSAPVVVYGMVTEIEKRTPFRRVMKQVIDRVQKAGAQGIKVVVSGRLDGAEIARTEMLSWGKIPLHTIRANIDYSRLAAFTTYGAVGIKVWIYKGDVFNKKEEKQ